MLAVAVRSQNDRRFFFPGSCRVEYLTCCSRLKPLEGFCGSISGFNLSRKSPKFRFWGSKTSSDRIWHGFNCEMLKIDFKRCQFMIRIRFLIQFDISASEEYWLRCLLLKPVLICRQQVIHICYHFQRTIEIKNNGSITFERAWVANYSNLFNPGRTQRKSDQKFFVNVDDK